MTKTDAGSMPAQDLLTTKGEDVFLNGQELLLPPVQRQFLHFLIRNAGTLCTHDMLLAELYAGREPAEVPKQEVLKTHVSYVRNALDTIKPGARALVQTILRHGYLVSASAVGQCEPENAHRRAAPETFSVAGNTIVFADLAWCVDGVRVDRSRMTAQPSRLLLYLLEHRGQTFSQAELYVHLHPDDVLDQETDLKLIDVLVCYIRKAFASVGMSDLIDTRWGRGYAIPAEREERTVPVPADLPERNTRWVPSRKEKVALAVIDGRFTPEEVAGFYPDLRPETVQSWVALVNRHGMRALRATRAHLYQRAA